MNQREALRRALEALEDYKYAEARTIIREALAQPEPEPVAWASKRTLDCIRDFDGYIYANGGFDDAVPLYTTPPHRKPLTSEEYSILAEKYTGADGLDCVDYGRAIARHYGIKE
jgi:hypothetical protein